MNIMSKLLFLSFTLGSMAQADDNQKPNRKLKDHIKAHNEKRKACQLFDKNHPYDKYEDDYSDDTINMFAQHHALLFELEKEARQLVEPLKQEFDELVYKSTNYSGKDYALQTIENFRKSNNFALLSKLAQQCYEKNNCDEFHKLEKELLSTNEGQAVKKVFNDYFYANLKILFLYETIENLSYIYDFESIYEALIESIDHIGKPLNPNELNYFSFLSIGQYTAPMFNQIKKEIIDSVNKICYEEDSQ